MNKKDIILIVVLALIASSSYFLTKLVTESDQKEAIVYYKNEVVKTIDLTIEEYQSITVRGELGFVTIEAENGAVRVSDEVSPLHLCQKQGWVSSNYTPIVCLPNNIIIKVVDKQDTVDAVVK